MSKVPSYISFLCTNPNLRKEEKIYMLSSSFSIQDVPNSKSLNIAHSLQHNLRPKSIQYYLHIVLTTYYKHLFAQYIGSAQVLYHTFHNSSCPIITAFIMRLQCRQPDRIVQRMSLIFMISRIIFQQVDFNKEFYQNVPQT